MTITLKTKPDGRGIRHYVTVGRADLDTLAEMAKTVSQSAGCAREEVQFTPTGRGQWIMAFHVVYPERNKS
jgi:hypothetical protein